MNLLLEIVVIVCVVALLIALLHRV